MSARPEVLREAAGIMRTGGLCSRVFEQNGAHCTIGAVMEAAGDFRMSAVYDETTLLAELLGVGYFAQVAAWNDEPGRTRYEVADLLEQAAEKAEAG